jgi:hypothetical protein
MKSITTKNCKLEKLEGLKRPVTGPVSKEE